MLEITQEAATSSSRAPPPCSPSLSTWASLKIPRGQGGGVQKTMKVISTGFVFYSGFFRKRDILLNIKYARGDEPPIQT